MTLALDNLNPHTIGAFDRAVEPARAKHVVRRIEFCDGPEHGSWLNTAENEPSATTSQCLSGRYFADSDASRDAMAAGATDVSERQRGVAWRTDEDR